VKRVMIGAMGHGHPETIVDNNFFNGLDINSSSDWIMDRIGIRQRRSVLNLEDIIALKAGRLTREDLVRAGKIPSMGKLAEAPWTTLKGRAESQGYVLAPDLVIAGTSVPDWDIPANACSIASHLDINCAAFDVNSACSSFVVDLHVARSLIGMGIHKQIAIFNIERYSTRLDFNDRNSCVLFGDGSASCLVQELDPNRQDSNPRGISGFEVIDTIIHSNPTGFRYVTIPDSGTFSQNGSVVQKFAVTKTVAVTLELLARNQIDIDQMSYFIGHQANLRMLTSVVEKLRLRNDQHLYNVDLYGNQGGAGAPAVISQNWDIFKPGDLVVVSVVGAGLTWGCALLKALP
jgi:3-oxoacyl-[acyl-carrier-protein] synthase-3